MTQASEAAVAIEPEPPMSVAEAQLLRFSIEEQIAKLLDGYAAKTGASVDDVRVERLDHSGGEATHVIKLIVSI